jgi:hypothetical protein
VQGGLRSAALTLLGLLTLALAGVVLVSAGIGSRGSDLDLGLLLLGWGLLAAGAATLWFRHPRRGGGEGPDGGSGGSPPPPPGPSRNGRPAEHTRAKTTV